MHWPSLTRLAPAQYTANRCNDPRPPTRPAASRRGMVSGAPTGHSPTHTAQAEQPFRRSAHFKATTAVLQVGTRHVYAMPPIVNSGPLLVTKDTLVHHIQYATLPTLGLLPAAIRDFLLHSVTGGYGLLSLSSAACRDCAKPLTCYSRQAASSAPCWLPERYCDAHPTNPCCGLLPPEAVQHRQASARTLLHEQARRQHEASRGLETAGRRRVRQRSPP